MLCTAALTACNSIEETTVPSGEQPLNLSVSVQKPGSRAIITGNALPDASQIGVFVTDNAGADYNNRGYANVLYTTSGTDCTSETDVLLDSKAAKLYAYHPYDENNADMTAIPVESTTLTDYMYATSGNTELSSTNASIELPMNHILSGVKVSIKKTDANTDYSVSKIKVKSQGIAKGANFNLTDASLSGFTGQNEAITWDDAIALTTEYQSTGIEYFVPTGTEEAVKFIVTVDGNDYALTSDQTLAMGKVYDFKLEFDNAGLNTEVTVSGVTVNGYGETSEELGTLEPCFEVNSAGKANGVYAVTAEGELIAYNDAAVDATCLGVALITDNQRIMIEKMGEANAEWNSYAELLWGYKLFNYDVAGITETTDETVAKADFNGKDHTNAIIAAYTEHSVAMSARDMCSILQTFNDGDNNVGYSDWYIPAAGQLYEIYTNKTNINTALSAMTATQLGTISTSSYYWSSSEWSKTYGCRVHFSDGGVDGSSKSDPWRVRFVRDIE